jgi:1-acyl-sn-glycerol-3-phosphate acyltransferase
LLKAVTIKNREPSSSLLFYRLVKWSVVNPILYTYLRGKVYGAEKIPQSGSYIIVCNHASNIDPPIFGVAAPRPVSFMAKEELFSVPLLKTVISLCGAYPVKRDASDLAAIKAAIKYIESGWLSGIFLGGTRTADGKIDDPKLGAALIAAKTQTPLIPASIWGTEKLQKSSNILKPTPVTVRFGDIIPPPQSKKKEDLKAVTEKCIQVIEAMHAMGR